MFLVDQFKRPNKKLDCKNYGTRVIKSQMLIDHFVVHAHLDIIHPIQLKKGKYVIGRIHYSSKLLG